MSQPPPVPPRLLFTDEHHYTTPAPCEDPQVRRRPKAESRQSEPNSQGSGDGVEGRGHDGPNPYTPVIDSPSANTAYITHTDAFVMRLPMGAEPTDHLVGKGVGTFSVVYTPDGTKSDGTHRRGRIWLCFVDKQGRFIAERIGCYKPLDGSPGRRYMVSNEPLMQGDSISGIILNFNNDRGNLGRFLQREHALFEMTRPYVPDDAREFKSDESKLAMAIAPVTPSTKSKAKLEDGAARAERIVMDGA